MLLSPRLRYRVLALILAVGLAGPGAEAPAQPPSEEAVPARPRPPMADPDVYRDWHWRMMEDGWHGGFGYGHWGFSLVIWGLIIAALVFAVSAARSSGGGGARSKTARELLEERYARGEIDRDEYRRRRDDLGSP